MATRTPMRRFSADVERGARARRRSTDGFSLLETALAVGVGSLLIAILGPILVSTSGAVSYVVQRTVGLNEASRLLDRLRDELHRSSPSHVEVTVASGGDSITLSEARATGATVVWGAYDDDGIFQQDGSIRYRVENGSVVRELLDAAGALVPPSRELVRDLVDDLGGDKGFEVVRNGSVVTITVRVRKKHPDGAQSTRSLTTSVFVSGS